MNCFRLILGFEIWTSFKLVVNVSIFEPASIRWSPAFFISKVNNCRLGKGIGRATFEAAAKLYHAAKRKQTARRIYQSH